MGQSSSLPSHNTAHSSSIITTDGKNGSKEYADTFSHHQEQNIFFSSWSLGPTQPSPLGDSKSDAWEAGFDIDSLAVYDNNTPLFVITVSRNLDCSHEKDNILSGRGRRAIPNVFATYDSQDQRLFWVPTTNKSSDEKTNRRDGTLAGYYLPLLWSQWRLRVRLSIRPVDSKQIDSKIVAWNAVTGVSGPSQTFVDDIVTKVFKQERNVQDHPSVVFLGNLNCNATDCGEFYAKPLELEFYVPLPLPQNNNKSNLEIGADLEDVAVLRHLGIFEYDRQKDAFRPLFRLEWAECSIWPPQASILHLQETPIEDEREANDRNNGTTEPRVANAVAAASLSNNVDDSSGICELAQAVEDLMRAGDGPYFHYMLHEMETKLQALNKHLRMKKNIKNLPDHHSFQLEAQDLCQKAIDAQRTFESHLDNFEAFLFAKATKQQISSDPKDDSSVHIKRAEWECQRMAYSHLLTQAVLRGTLATHKATKSDSPKKLDHLEKKVNVALEWMGDKCQLAQINLKIAQKQQPNLPYNYQQHSLPIKNTTREGYLAVSVQSFKNSKTNGRRPELLWCKLIEGCMEEWSLDPVKLVRRHSLSLCSLKKVNVFCWQIINGKDETRTTYSAACSSEAAKWQSALTQAITACIMKDNPRHVLLQEGHPVNLQGKDLVNALKELHSRGDKPLECTDCAGTVDVEWAVFPNGILVCTECAGGHRSLGTHISRVRSILLDEFKEGELQMLLENASRKKESIGNNGDAIFSANPDSISHETVRKERWAFIRQKYAGSLYSQRQKI